MRILCLGLAVLFGGVTSLPAHYHSCTFNFTGGPRLPFPFCNASLDVRPLCIPQMRGSAPGDATVAPIGRFPRARPALPHDLRRKERRPRCVQSGGRASRSSEHDRRGVHAWGQQRLRQEVKREHRLPDDIPIGRGPRCFVRSAAVARNWAHDRHRSAWAEQPGAHAQRLSYAFLCPLPAPCAQAFDDSANVVPGIPPNGPSGLYFLDPNIVRPQATPLSPSRVAALGGSLTTSRSIRSAGVWCCNAGRHIATSHEMPHSKQYERLH